MLKNKSQSSKTNDQLSKHIKQIKPPFAYSINTFHTKTQFTKHNPPFLINMNTFGLAKTQAAKNSNSQIKAHVRQNLNIMNTPGFSL